MSKFAGKDFAGVCAMYMVLEQQLAAEKAAREKAEAEMLRLGGLNAENFGRAKAAETKLKELSEQEPASIVDAVFVCPNTDGKYRAEVLSKDRLSQGDELFSRPIPSPEVAELQLRLDKTVEDYLTAARENAELRKRIAELEAKC